MKNMAPHFQLAESETFFNDIVIGKKYYLQAEITKYSHVKDFWQTKIIESATISVRKEMKKMAEQETIKKFNAVSVVF